jgi:hypothetical protein
MSGLKKIFLLSQERHLMNLKKRLERLLREVLYKTNNNYIKMKVFPEYFDQVQFTLNRENMHTIKRPYINYYKTLNFAFQEYNANLKL